VRAGNFKAVFNAPIGFLTAALVKSKMAFCGKAILKRPLP
jgi:hypothetical protein